ncbi:MAG: hypothetical protein HZC22_13840 [Rhodocyclales bacterium]|nr:hypothetical protein [Rhodocyclales bacterium]
MPSSRYPESELLVPNEQLVEHATLGVLKNAAAGLPGMTDWLAGAVRKEPVLIHDINGQPLFHDFEVARGSRVFGTVRVAASTVIGAGVVSTEIGPRLWDYASAVRKLTPTARKDLAVTRVSSPKLVCYSYPKLGVMFEADGPQGRTRVIYDVASLERVPDAPPRGAMEGCFAWSYYDALADDDRKTRIARFKKVEQDRGGIPLKLRKQIATARTITPIAEELKLKLRINVTRLLQYCTHYASDHARSHHCFSLHGQQVNDYCAVATCQMILCYYRYYYTQNEIAPALGYSPGGGCPADQSAGYKSLTCKHLDSSYDAAATWEKARDQINLLRPFKSGIPGHARACAGYSYLRWLWGGGITDKKLYVYDPWPWNADYALGGAVTWEDWDAITHTNFVYANIDCP